VTSVFVTGTGTDVGKTFVTGALIRRLRASGQEVDAIKPVVSGFDPAALSASDPGVLIAALGRPVTPAEIDRISPWRFAAPLSPDMAAAREGRVVDFEALVAYCRSRAASTRGVVFIEGVGGIMVPLDDRHTVLDWITALRVPVIVVAGSYLGTISHTLTALHVLARRNVDIAAVGVSESTAPGASLEGTVESVARFAGTVEVIGVPRLSRDAAHLHPAIERLVALL
jgi:dethiobiotin synthetase